MRTFAQILFALPTWTSSIFILVFISSSSHKWIFSSSFFQSSAFPFFTLLLCLHSTVPTGAGVQGESGDHRRWLHSGWEKCDHHEPPHPPGLDVPVVLSAQVQLPAAGEDLPQGCPEGCSWLRWVCTKICHAFFPPREVHALFKAAFW